MYDREKRKRLTPLETKCITKWFFSDIGLINTHSSTDFKALGIEKRLETILELAQKEPITLRVEARNENDFTIYFDEDFNGKFEEVFVMKDGVEIL